MSVIGPRTESISVREHHILHLALSVHRWQLAIIVNVLQETVNHPVTTLSEDRKDKVKGQSHCKILPIPDMRERKIPADGSVRADRPCSNLKLGFLQAYCIVGAGHP